ncbi:fruit protein pKIWI502-like isoform X2 [Phragmites australis]|uniref:fruit protein pKIWI502-like isoform X2 n=1 Tax=Phragmites australis TaxID=29695 RepID=UPI002D785864|nr:fruit protein pKIWI502-like isoform X2 [Phragmites australis]
MAAVSAPPRPTSLLPIPSFASTSHLPMRALPILRRRVRPLTTAYAVRQDAAVWTPAPVSAVGAANADGSVFHVAVDLSDAAELADSYVAPGQYLQVRVPSGGDGELKPAFMAVASPPSAGARFEFLIKSVPGTTAERLCGLRDGDVVELGAVMGKGFLVERLAPPDSAQTVLIFAAGTGISTIRSLVESGFAANERADVRLYYGARSLQAMAYQDRFKNWESTGLKIIPVLSQPDDSWKGERGYVQHAFLRAKNIVNPSSTGAVLCGQKQMHEEITVALVADGVSQDKILTNF